LLLLKPDTMAGPSFSFAPTFKGVAPPQDAWVPGVSAAVAGPAIAPVAASVAIALGPTAANASKHIAITTPRFIFPILARNVVMWHPGLPLYGAALSFVTCL
jgi:hypothetical protein